MNYIIYHNKDLDGFCSGSIAKKHFFDEGKESKMIGWNYGDPVPSFQDAETITLVDISFPKEVMLELYRGHAAYKYSVVWIDHHKSAIDDSQELDYSDLPGVRRIGDSASWLAWEYYYGSPVPQLVYWVDRYDVWKQGKDWDKVLAIQHGMRLGLGDPDSQPKWFSWIAELNQMGDYFEKDGNLILSFLRKENERIAERVQLCPFLRIPIVNYDRPDIDILNLANPKLSKIGAIGFWYDDGEKIVWSLRKKKESKVDILLLAKKRGGGGHECACGFMEKL